MNILCISDTHNRHNLIPSEYLTNSDGIIDILIHSGDVSGRGSRTEITNFLDWFSKLPFKHKIFIAGNHDFFFEQAPEYEIESLLSNYPNIIYLNDSGIEIEGLKIWGSPITPYFYNWAFNRVGDTIKQHWNLIPSDTNILITHGGPKNVGFLNTTSRDKIDVGCPYLTEKISELNQLKLFVQGHIHEGYGYFYLNDSLYVNCSVLNENYYMKNKPMVINTTNWSVI